MKRIKQSELFVSDKENYICYAISTQSSSTLCFRFIGISSLGQQDVKVEKRMAITLVILSWVWAAMIASPMILKDPVTNMDLLGYDKAAGKIL